MYELPNYCKMLFISLNIRLPTVTPIMERTFSYLCVSKKLYYFFRHCDKLNASFVFYVNRDNCTIN